MYKITALRRVTNTKNPYFLEYGFEKLAKFLTLPREGIKNTKYPTIPAWSPASFNGQGLCSEHVTEISCMVYDIDDGLLFEEHKRFHPWQYIAYSSPSHTTDHHKWRLVIPFEDPIPVQYWDLVWDSMIRMFEKKTNSLMNGGKIDKSCKDPRRFYFMGKKTKWFECHINSKGYNYWVNLEEIIKQKNLRDAAQKKAMELQRKKLREALKRPQRNRDEYAEMRMNLNINYKYRMVLAERIGARITQGSNPRAVDWECTGCKRSDCTFFYIYPNSNRLGAFCNHRNSCGLSLGLFDLGRLKGVF